MTFAVFMQLQFFNPYKFWEAVAGDREDKETMSKTNCAWSRVLLKKLTVTQLVKKFSTFYGTWWFITMFTRACCWSLSWVRCIQSTPLHPVSLRSIPVSSHLCLGLPSGLFPNDFINVSDFPARRRCLKKNVIPSQNLPVCSCKKSVRSKDRERKKQEKAWISPEVLLHAVLTSRHFKSGARIF